MKIQLVSLPAYKRLTLSRYSKHLEIVKNVLKESDADFIMFSEHLFRFVDDLKFIKKVAKNKSITVLVELNEGVGLNKNRTYLLQNGEWEYLGSQIFAQSEDAAGGIETLIDAMYGEYDGKRQFIVCGKRFLFVQCGENNILKGSTGIAEFRLKNRPDLENRFEELLGSVDVVLNPVHDKWGRFANFLTRIRKFSENGRYCFSNCQLVGNQLEAARKNPAHNTAHVAMHNSELIAPIYTNQNEDYLVQTFEIE
jgi:hypothetical protein